MELHRAHRPVDDPFFGAVRRRHSDVDILLLDREPAPREAEPVDGAEIDAALGSVRDLSSTLLPADPVPLIRWRYGPDPSRVSAEARWTARRDDGAEVLARLQQELTGRHWRVRRPAAGTERLTATGGGFTLAASWAAGSGALLVTVIGPGLVVGEERARRLVRGER